MKISTALAALGLLAGSAFAGPITYIAHLNGSSEAPPNASAGTGLAMVIFDTTAHTLDVTVNFDNLTGTTTASHIHCCTAVPGTGTAGVATTVPTFTDFPLGVTSGSYHHLFDTSLDSSFNPSFVSAHGGTADAAEAFLAAGAAAGMAYLNVHSSVYGGGEIRGFLVPTPEPGTFALFALSGLTLVLMRRRG